MDCFDVDADTILYRYFDVDGNLLCLGITNQPEERYRAHGGARWRGRAKFYCMEGFPSRYIAELAERWAIIMEDPEFNLLGEPPKPTVRARVGDYFAGGCGLAGDGLRWITVGLRPETVDAPPWADRVRAVAGLEVATFDDLDEAQMWTRETMETAIQLPTGELGEQSED